jgi:para-nitrobenzyl esterase
MNGEFQRAIIQSGGTNAMVYPIMPVFMPNARTLEDAEKLGVEFMKHLGVKTLAEARELDDEYVLKKYNEFGFRNIFVPIIDNKFAFADPADAMVKGKVNDVDIMVTATGDEFMVGPREPLGEWIEKSYGKHAAEYMRLVRYAAGNDNPDDLKRAANFSTFYLANRLTAEILAEKCNGAYFSVFDPYIPGDGVGSFHSCDLWFEFETLMHCWRPFDGHHFDLARKMCNYFANFARTGDPNGNDADGTQMPKWEKYTTANRHGIIFGDEITMEEKTDARIRLMLDANLEMLGLK